MQGSNENKFSHFYIVSVEKFALYRHPISVTLPRNLSKTISKSFISSQKPIKNFLETFFKHNFFSLKFCQKRKESNIIFVSFDNANEQFSIFNTFSKIDEGMFFVKADLVLAN